MVAVGEESPDFTLETDEETRVSLKDYRGKKVVLYFYPKDGTPGCTTEALEFKDVAHEFAKEGAVILGISKDSVKSHQKFKEKHQLPFTLLSDPEAKVINAYGVWKEKLLYGRKFMGTERTTFLIDEKERNHKKNIHQSEAGRSCPSLLTRFETKNKTLFA